MGAMHETFTTVTAKDIAKNEGVDIATIRHRWNSHFAKGTFDSNRELSPEQVEKLSRTNKPKSKPARKPRAAKDNEAQLVHVNQPEPAGVTNEAEALPARQTWQTWMLYGLLAAPTAASLHNMFTITQHIAGNPVDAILLTTVLAGSAIGFIVAGAKNRWTFALAVVLIGYESFCNLTRIYGGLMGVGKSGNPTRFLGLVTDIFESGSHATAISIGAITALFIAAVQYAAVFELNKK